MAAFVWFGGLLAFVRLYCVSALAEKVYRFEEAVHALEKGLDIRTIYTKIQKSEVTEIASLRINYYFQETYDTINYYDTQLMVDMRSSSVVYDASNAAIYSYNTSGSITTYLHLHSSYLNAGTLAVKHHSDENYTLSNQSEANSFYFNIVDSTTYIDHLYKIRNFEELCVVLQNGAKVRMRINLTSNETDIVSSGKVIETNRDIFNVLMTGIHSEHIGDCWQSIKDIYVSWTAQQMIIDPFKTAQYYILSTNTINVKGIVDINSAIVDQSMQIAGWINVTASFKQVAFYSDIELL